MALAGSANMVDEWGGYPEIVRYMPRTVLDGIGMAWAEGEQAGMGGPPWSRPTRYVAMSPIFHADRIQTPLLIIQGDLDAVDMEQGEEMFSALYRQGKRAEFVRYWGESPIIASPANIRDMWGRIFAWFDRYPGVAHR